MKFEKKYHGVQVEYYFGDKYTNFNFFFQKWGLKYIVVYVVQLKMCRPFSN